MAKQLKDAYRDLWEIYPDAHKKSTSELMDFFSTKTSAGKQVLNLTVGTFNVLCEFADFGEKTDLEEAIQKAEEITVTVKKPPTEVVSQFPLTVNIEIQLPITENVEVYDKIFEALRKHLIDRKK